MRNRLLFLSAMLLASVVTHAAEKKIILSVPDMNCPSCPFMIERSVKLVDGVQSAEAELKSRTCTVVFDDAVASVEDILGATAGIGYKSTLIDTENGS